MLEKLRALLKRSAEKPGAGSSPSDAEAAAIAKRIFKVTSLPTLGLAVYQSLLAGIRPPTDEQIHQFALHVSNARSWYKHLPRLPPGAPFLFYIDPWAGMDKIVTSAGQSHFLVRPADHRGFHYSWLPTEEYRRRFGHLNFSCAVGTALLMPATATSAGGGSISGLVDASVNQPVIYIEPDRAKRLPVEVREAGTTSLTGVIHSLMDSWSEWTQLLEPPPRPLTWPEETGGLATLELIRERVKRARDLDRAHRSGQSLDEKIPELGDLLAPERARLQGEMTAAMKRMRTLVYERS